jgi:hypothetical protein
MSRREMSGSDVALFRCLAPTALHPCLCVHVSLHGFLHFPKHIHPSQSQSGRNRVFSAPRICDTRLVHILTKFHIFLSHFPSVPVSGSLTVISFNAPSLRLHANAKWPSSVCVDAAHCSSPLLWSTLPDPIVNGRCACVNAQQSRPCHGIPMVCEG